MDHPKTVTVEKAIDLRDGEELQGFIKEAISAIRRVKGVDGKANDDMFLTGIFKDHLVARTLEKGKFFRFQFTRDGSGVLKLGKGMEVKQIFAPVAAVEKSEDPDQHVEVMLAIAKSASIETEEHPIVDDPGWGSVLGT